MNTPAINTIQDVHKLVNKLELLKKTAEQVQKDFSIYDIPITFSGNESSAYDELKNQIAPEIGKLYHANYSAFLNLLYRIDIQESKIKNITAENFISELTDLILIRELQKVVIRTWYKQ